MINSTFEYNSLILNNITNDIWQNWDYVITKVKGLDNPDLRQEIEDKAANHGQNDYGQYLGGRLITLEGKIMGESDIDKNTLRDALDKAFIKDGVYRWLKFQPTGGVAKQIYCKVFDKDIPDEYQGMKYFRDFTINLLAVDPRIYSQTETTSTVYIPTSTGGFSFPLTFPLSFGTARVGGSITCNNLGNFESLPLVKMYGPLNAPEIKNITDDNKYIKINMVINTGDYLEIDFENHTIMLNNTASRYLYLDSGSEWFSLLAGNNSLTFKDSGGNIDGYCTITWKSAWI
ncbi:MAG: phage tail family protein, partial [Porphyromonadaceae bacterium]|nr:phage tail family protein [Porphyromonadaceae bacterium]